MKRFPYGAAVLAVAVIGCATESLTPPQAHYLIAGPAPHYSAQVEMLKGSMIQLRSGDILLEAQAQRIQDAVGVQFYVINLSEHAIRLEAKDFSLLDAQGGESRPLNIKDILTPLRARAAELQERPKNNTQMTTAEAVINPGDAGNGGSTNERMAKTLREDTDRLEKTLEAPFSGAVIPVSKKIGGMLYFSRPARWPVQLNVHAGGQILAASFYQAEENP